MFTATDFPLSQNDLLLKRHGYNLVEECAQAVALASFRPGSSVLDVASGGGRMAFCLAAAGFDTTSGDIDPATIEQTRAKLAFMGAAAPRFMLLDACAMNLADASVPALASANAIHEMPDPEKMLRECARVLTPDGAALFTDFSDKGFDTIDLVHKELFGRLHTRGKIGGEEITALLGTLFSDVSVRALPLNRAWLCRGKKNG